MNIYNADDSRYNSMKYNFCGNSGLKLSAISLGLWHNFGGVDQFLNMQSLIFRSFDLGITHFDLANNYGPPPGSAEENFGKILAQDLSRYRDELIISSKAGYDMWPGPYGDFGSKKYLISSLDQSLKRLGLDYVDIFYHHRPDPKTPLEETMGALAQIVRQGKALYVGLSNYSAEQTEKAAKILQSMNIHCLIHQPKYSMFERWVEDDLLKVLKKQGIGCIPFSPLAQGLLTDKYLNGIPENSRAAKETGFLQKTEITNEKIFKIKALNTIANDREQTLSQLAIAWILRHEEITTVLVGASKVSQIENNVAALKNLTLSKNELDKIENILKG